MTDNLKRVLAFRADRDWEQFHEAKNLAIDLGVEAAEVLELFLWTKNNALPEEKKQALADELADVYHVLLLLAHDHGIDLEAALDKKMYENEKKYPIEKAKGKNLKYTEL